MNDIQKMYCILEKQLVKFNYKNYQKITTNILFYLIFYFIMIIHFISSALVNIYNEFGGDIIKLSEKKMLRKKEQILTSAIEIINRRGYSGTTMEEIAAELLMTKGSLYYYFKNKSELMYHCHQFFLNQAIKELEEILNSNGTAGEILKKMAAVHIMYATEEKEVFNLIMDPKQFFNQEQLELVLKLRKSYEELFDEAISKGIEKGEFHIKEATTARMFILGGLNWIQQWYKPNGRLTKEEIISLYSDYIIKLLK